MIEYLCMCRISPCHCVKKVTANAGRRVNMKNKIIATALAVAMLALSGCSPGPVAITVDGREVDASEYASYLDMRRYDEGSLEEERNTEQASELAIELIVTNEVIRIKCEQFGLELTEEQTAQLEADKQKLIETLGGNAAYLEYLDGMAMADRTYDKFQRTNLYYTMLYDYMAQQTEQDYTDQQLRTYFAENFGSFKYIMLATLDEIGQPLSDTDMHEAQQLAQLIYMEAVRGDTDFNTLIETYSEDMGMSAQSPGVIIDSLSVRGSEPHLQQAFAELSDGEIGGVYEGEDGLYIVQRLGTPASYYEQNRDYILQSLQTVRFEQMLDEWTQQAEVIVHDIVAEINLDNYAEYIK